MTLGKMTDVYKVINRQQFGGEPAYIWIWIRINLDLNPGSLSVEVRFLDGGLCSLSTVWLLWMSWVGTDDVVQCCKWSLWDVCDYVLVLRWCLVRTPATTCLHQVVWTTSLPWYECCSVVFSLALALSSVSRWLMMRLPRDYAISLFSVYCFSNAELRQFNAFLFFGWWLSV